jgi:uncharacterized protein YoxC
MEAVNEKRETSNWFAAYTKEKPLEVTLQIIGVAILLLNIWLTTKLAPLAEDIRSLNVQVQAVDRNVASYSLDHDDLQVIKSKVTDIQMSINELNDNINYLIRK